MKKRYFILFIFIVSILGACSSTSNELEREVFNVFTWDPTIDAEDISENINPSSNLEFNFKSSDKVEIKSGGEKFEGNYSFENNTLSVDLIDENNEDLLTLEFNDYTQHEQNEKLYTGTISKLDIKSDEYHRVGSNFSLGEYLGFYKTD